MYDLFICLFIYDGTRGSTQDLAIARQALYNLNHSASPFCVGFYF
jgi:hypothetical protein